MNTLAERWPIGMDVEVRGLDGLWLPARVLSTGHQPAEVLRLRHGAERVEVEMADGKRALISEGYNGQPSLRPRS